MDIAFSAESVDDIDDSIREAIEAAPGLPIRLRVQPQIFTKREGNGQRRHGMNLGWKGVYWNLTCTTLEDAQLFREALTAFFQALGRVSTQELIIGLDNLAPTHVESTLRHEHDTMHTAHTTAAV